MLKREVYEITLRVVSPLLGSQPPSQEVWERYIIKKLEKELNKLEKMKASEEKKLGEELPEDHPIVQKISEIHDKIEKIEKKLLDDLDETEEKITVFPRAVVNGQRVIVLKNYQILGLFKEVASNFYKHIKGQKNLITQYFNVRPHDIPILDEDGNMIDSPDDVLERILRAMSPQGPITLPIKSEMLNPPLIIRFRLYVYGAGELHPFTEDVIREMLEIASEQGGLLQWRSSHYYGQFEIQEFKRLKA